MGDRLRDDLASYNMQVKFKYYSKLEKELLFEKSVILTDELRARDNMDGLLDSVCVFSEVFSKVYDKNHYFYDSNGKLIKVEDLSWNGYEWVFGKISVYTYNSKGEKSTFSIYHKYSGSEEWKKNEETQYFYSTDGKLIGEKYYSRSSGDTIKTEITYDSKGNKLTELSYKWSNNAWKPSNKVEYAYDSKGNMASRSSYSLSDNGSWPLFKREFTYDNDGNNTEKIFYKESNKKWVHEIKVLYTYDKQKNKETESCYTITNGEWTLSTITKYYYHHVN